jgi:DNA-binding transcriptional LysR family regulator
VTRRNNKPRGTLKVSAPTSFSRLHIAPYLPEFLNRFPEIEFDLHLTDNFVDIIKGGFDLAVRIGELEDSSLFARKLAPETRVICAAPRYLEKAGIPTSLEDLQCHNCLSAGAQDVWRVDGPGGPQQLRVKGNIRTNSAEFVREALLTGLGIGLRSTWDIGPELQSGDLKIVLPDYRGATSVQIHAVYPCRDFMPEKVTVFIDFLAGRYGNDPYWNKGLDFAKYVCAPAAKPAAQRGPRKAVAASSPAGVDGPPDRTTR